MLLGFKNNRKGFGLIEILAVLILIFILYTVRMNTAGKSISMTDNIQHQIAVKKHAENQVKDIQQMLTKRYKGYQ